MKKDPLTRSAVNNGKGGQETRKDARLPYEAPELISYNTSEITLGGAVRRGVDFTGGAGTSYKS